MGQLVSWRQEADTGSWRLTMKVFRLPNGLIEEELRVLFCATGLVRNIIPAYH